MIGTETPRILFTIDGEDYDHLGRGLLGLPDIDGDGIPDLLISAVGHALVCSGKDGCVIYRLATPEDHHPDPLPRHPALVGDLDGDGRPDFSLEGEPAFEDLEPHAGHVNLHSSATGECLAKYGGALLETPGAMFATRALVAGDLDGDGNLEILVESWKGTHEAHLYTFGSDVPTASAEGIPLGSTPDVDGDRVRDVLLCGDAWYQPWGNEWGWIVSGSNGTVLSRLANPGFRGRLRAANNAGDVNLDGFPDVLFVHGLTKEEPYAVDGEIAFECHLLSGRDGSILQLWTEEPWWRGLLLDAGGLDDLGGDGIRELFTSIRDTARAESRIRIYSGSTRELLLELSSKTEIEGSHVTSVGDLDRDGVAELLVSDHEAGECAGRAIVYSVGGALR